MEQSLEICRRLQETSVILDELMAEVRALKVAVQLAEMLQIEGGASVEAAATLAPVKMSGAAAPGDGKGNQANTPAPQGGARTYELDVILKKNGNDAAAL